MFCRRSKQTILGQEQLKNWILSRHLIRRWPLCLVLLLSTFFPVQADFPNQTSTIGKGNSGVAVFSDANSLKNPANLAEYGQYHLGFERSPSGLFQVLETNQLSSTFPLSSRLALGLNWSQIGLEDEELTISKNRFHLSYSYLLTDWLSVGANLKYLTSNASLDGRRRGSEIGWGTDLGLLVHLRHFSLRNNLLAPIWSRLSTRSQFTSTRWKIQSSWTFGLVATDILDLGLQPDSNWGTWIRHDTGVIEKYRSPQLHLGLGYQPSVRWQLSADLSDRLNVGVEFRPYQYLALRTGLYHRLSVQSQFRPTLTLGASLQYKTFSFDWAYLLPAVLSGTTYVRFSLHLDRRTLPIQIEQIRLKNLYPVHYNFYAQTNRAVSEQVLANPNQPTVLSAADLDRYYPLMADDTIGRIWLKNESPKPHAIRVELFIPEFVSVNGTEVASQIVIPPLKRISVPLRQIVLTRQAIHMRQAQTVEAKIKVTQVGGTAHRLLSTQLTLYGNHSTRLDDIAKLSSFIPYDDPGVRSFVDQVKTTFGAKINSTSLPADLSLAVVLFDALYGLAYTKDPNIPFESGTVDEITYPFEMLKRLSNQKKNSTSHGESEMVFGDCDDSTVLYCALLESVGINTALVQLPNHVLMAFQVSKMSIETAQTMGLPDIYLPINGQVWIPIETTLVQAGFATAWQIALSQLQQIEVMDSVTVDQAWEKYGANALHHPKMDFLFDFEIIQHRIQTDFDHYLTKYFNQSAGLDFDASEK